jgi:hypothetical protein
VSKSKIPQPSFYDIAPRTFEEDYFLRQGSKIFSYVAVCTEGMRDEGIEAPSVPTDMESFRCTRCGHHLWVSEIASSTVKLVKERLCECCFNLEFFERGEEEELESG